MLDLNTLKDMSPEDLATSLKNNLSMDELIALLSKVLMNNGNTQSQNTNPPPANAPFAQPQVPPVPVGPVQNPAPKPAFQRFQTRTREALMRDVLDEYVEQNRDKLILPAMLANEDNILDVIYGEIMESYQSQRQLLNMSATKDETKVPDIAVLPPHAVVQLLINTGEVARLAASANTQGTKLIVKRYFKNASTNGKYKWSGEWKIVTEDDESSGIPSIFNRLCSMSAGAQGTMMKTLRQSANLVYMRKDDTLTFWRNGVYDMANARFMAYDDPAYEATYGKFITLRKCHTNHPLGKPWGNRATCKIDANGKAIEPVITMPDGKEWKAMDGLEAPFNMGTEVGDASLLLILQAAQFMLRGRGGKPGMFHFWINYGCNGGNGKGFLADLFARLIQLLPDEIGEGDEDLSRSEAIGHLPIEKMGEKFNLDEKSILWMMNAAGETNTTQEGKKIEDTALLKSLSRKEYITIQGKFEKAMEICLDYVWWIQMANNMPRVNEKNGSVISCIIAIPFEVQLGRERPYIKEDYIRREEVASFYAWYLTCALPLYDQYDKNAMEVLKPFKQAMLENSMNTLQFFKEAVPLIAQDVIPAEELFEIYIRWADIKGFKFVVDFNTFTKDMEQFGMDNEMGIEFTRKPKRIKAKDIEDHHMIQALKQWGYSKKYGVSKFTEEEYTHGSRVSGRLNMSEIVFSRQDKDGKIMTTSRQFCSGCFVRTTSWRNIKGCGYFYADDSEPDADEVLTTVA